MLAYRSTQLLLRAATHVFFKDVSVAGLGNVPAEGERPVLFAGNHPNSLIDPVLICTTSGRIVHFAAKDQLFRFPLKPILTALGAVPIARRMDYAEGERPRDNAAALDQLHGVLGRGRAVGIFPEGLSHNEAHLQALRTGAARVALEAAAKRGPRGQDDGVQVICCGLQYAHRRRFRSRVLVQYGPPIDIDATWVEAYRRDPREAAGALTKEIEAGIRALTVNAADWDTLRVLDGVRRLYQPPHIRLQDRVELARRFSDVYQTVREVPAVQQLYTRVKAYLDRLRDAGLTDRDLVRGLRPLQLWARIVQNLATLLLWVPLAILGAPLHGPLLLAVGWMGRTFAPRKDVIGTSKLIFGLMAVGATYVVVPILVGALFDWRWGAALALTLPGSGFATLRVLERGASLRRLWRSAAASLRLGQELKELQDWRAELESDVVAAVQRFIPEDMQPLFPRGERPDVSPRPTSV
jgi:glycerol-3-phosphate O-acyltransferase / dihydroxyacetone phosphate acyltransferase